MTPAALPTAQISVLVFACLTSSLFGWSPNYILVLRQWVCFHLQCGSGSVPILCCCPVPVLRVCSGFQGHVPAPIKASLAMLIKSALLLVFSAVLTWSHDHRDRNCPLSSHVRAGLCGRPYKHSDSHLFQWLLVVQWHSLPPIARESRESGWTADSENIFLHYFPLTQCCSTRWWSLTVEDLIWVSWAEAWAVFASSQQPPTNALSDSVCS